MGTWHGPYDVSAGGACVRHGIVRLHPEHRASRSQSGNPGELSRGQQARARCRRAGAGLVAGLSLQRTDLADGRCADLQSGYCRRLCTDHPGRRTGRGLRCGAVADRQRNGQRRTVAASGRQRPRFSHVLPV